MRRVLFFINGPVPDGEDLARAARLGTRMFRNALVAERAGLERCEAVAGAAPAKYRAAYPDAEDELRAADARREQARADEERGEAAAAAAGNATAASEQPLPPGEIALLDPKDVTGPASAEPIPQPHTEPEAPRSRRAKR